MIKKNQKNMEEYDKWKSHKRSKIRVICISSNNVRHSVTKIFTTLHPTTLHSTSLRFSTLHFLPFKVPLTTLHYPHIWLNPIWISYRPISPHITTELSVMLVATVQNPVSCGVCTPVLSVVHGWPSGSGAGFPPCQLLASTLFCSDMTGC